MLKPAEDVRLSLIDDAGILFAERSQQVFAFNTVAAYLWLCLQDGDDVATMARRLATDLAVAPADAAAHVDQALAQWRDLGLLAGNDRPDAPPKPSREFARATTTLHEPAAVRRYRILDSVVEVRFPSVAAEATSHPVVAHFEDPVAAPTHRIDIVPRGDGFVAQHDGSVYETCDGLRTLGPVVKYLTVHLAIGASQPTFYLHAGVVEAADGALLLSGAPGAGKSSLTAGLVRAGYGYFSDEMALLDAPDYAVRPVPVSLCVKQPGWPLVERLFPSLRGLPAHRRIDGKVVKYLPPPVPADMAARRPVRAVIFPRYDPAATTELQPVARVEALRRLMDECLAIATVLTHGQVGALAKWIAGVDCYTLPTSSLADSVAAVRAVLPPRNRTHSGSMA